MSKLAFLLADEFDLATLTGGSGWSIEQPVTCLQDMQPGNKAITVDLTGFTLDVDALSAKPWDAFAVINHNGTAAATFTVKAATSQANLTSAPSYAPAAFPAFPVTGKPTDRELTRFNSFGLMTPGGSFRWWRFKMTDAANPDGVLTAGRLMMGRKMQPQYSNTPGRDFGHEPSDIQTHTTYGGVYTERRPGPRRRGTLPFDFVRATDANELFPELYRLTGYHRDMFLILNTDDTTYRHRRMMQCVIDARVPPRINQAHFDVYRTRLDVVEVY